MEEEEETDAAAPPAPAPQGPASRTSGQSGTLLSMCGWKSGAAKGTGSNDGGGPPPPPPLPPLTSTLPDASLSLPRLSLTYHLPFS